MPVVKAIKFVLVMSDGTRVAEFHQPEKVADLMTAEDVTLGQFLRDLATAELARKGDGN